MLSTHERSSLSRSPNWQIAILVDRQIDKTSKLPKWEIAKLGNYQTGKTNSQTKLPISANHQTGKSTNKQTTKMDPRGNLSQHTNSL